MKVFISNMIIRTSTKINEIFCTYREEQRRNLSSGEDSSTDTSDMSEDSRKHSNKWSSYADLYLDHRNDWR